MFAVGCGYRTQQINNTPCYYLRKADGERDETRPTLYRAMYRLAMYRLDAPKADGFTSPMAPYLVPSTLCFKERLAVSELGCHRWCMPQHVWSDPNASGGVRILLSIASCLCLSCRPYLTDWQRIEAHG